MPIYLRVTRGMSASILTYGGILQSIASRNDHDRAMERLAALGIDGYFLHPRIDWSAKGQNVERIAKLLNIGLDMLLSEPEAPEYVHRRDDGFGSHARGVSD